MSQPKPPPTAADMRWFAKHSAKFHRILGHVRKQQQVASLTPERRREIAVNARAVLTLKQRAAKQLERINNPTN